MGLRHLPVLDEASHNVIWVHSHTWNLLTYTFQVLFYECFDKPGFNMQTLSHVQSLDYCIVSHSLEGVGLILHVHVLWLCFSCMIRIVYQKRHTVHVHHRSGWYYRSLCFPCMGMYVSMVPLVHIIMVWSLTLQLVGIVTRFDLTHEKLHELRRRKRKGATENDRQWLIYRTVTCTCTVLVACNTEVCV